MDESTQTEVQQEVEKQASPVQEDVIKTATTSSRFYSKSFSIGTEVVDGKSICDISVEELVDVDGEHRVRRINKTGLSEMEARSIIEQFLKSSL